MDRGKGDIFLYFFGEKRQMNRCQKFTKMTFRFFTFLTGIVIFSQLAMVFARGARAASPPPTTSVTTSLTMERSVSHSDHVSRTNSNPVNQGNPANRGNSINDGNNLSNSNLVSNVVSDTEMSVNYSDRSDDELRSLANPSDSCYDSLPSSASESSLATEENDSSWRGYLDDSTIEEHFAKKDSMSRKGRRLYNRFMMDGNQQHRHFIRKHSTINILMGKQIDDAIVYETELLKRHRRNGPFVGEPFPVPEETLSSVRTWQTTYKNGKGILNNPNPPN
jgi:hypothetical protein